MRVSAPNPGDIHDNSNLFPSVDSPSKSYSLVQQIQEIRGLIRMRGQIKVYFRRLMNSGKPFRAQRRIKL